VSNEKQDIEALDAGIYDGAEGFEGIHKPYLKLADH